MQLWNAMHYMYGDATTVRNNHSLNDGVDSNNSVLWTKEGEGRHLCDCSVTL
jgi:hypothetical protein